MKKISVLALAALLFAVSSCKKDKVVNNSNDIPSSMPRTTVPTAVQGVWMYGNFSTTEYWNQNPADYIGNGFEIAIAFKFYANGTYEQYFTSATVNGTVRTYHQSVTIGTVEIDPANGTLVTHAWKAHYKRSSNGQVQEERDLTQNEIIEHIHYDYETGTETNGTPAIYLLMENTDTPFTFLKK